MNEQQVPTRVTLAVGNEFPEWELDGVAGTTSEIQKLKSTQYNGWKVYYFYPKDFTYICPTEIVAMDDLRDEATVFGISGDNEHCKVAWKNSDKKVGSIKHTLIADVGLNLAHSIGVVDSNNEVCMRATFIVDPQNIIQHLSVNALDTGRSAVELKRTLLALKSGGLTGCEWNPGDQHLG